MKTLPVLPHPLPPQKQEQFGLAVHTAVIPGAHRAAFTDGVRTIASCRKDKQGGWGEERGWHKSKSWLESGRICHFFSIKDFVHTKHTDLYFLKTFWNQHLWSILYWTVNLPSSINDHQTQKIIFIFSACVCFKGVCTATARSVLLLARLPLEDVTSTVVQMAVYSEPATKKQDSFRSLYHYSSADDRKFTLWQGRGEQEATHSTVGGLTVRIIPKYKSKNPNNHNRYISRISFNS